ELERRCDALRRLAVMERRKAAGAEKPPEHPPLNPDFAPLLKALAALRASASGLDRTIETLQGHGESVPGSLPRINDAVVQVERKFLSGEGLTGRPWFKHVLYAPGLTTGYASCPFPGLTQAIKDHDAALWDKELQKVLSALSAAAGALDAAS